MAISSFCNSFLLGFFVITCVFSTLTFGDNNLITSVCKQAHNPSLCLKSLKSDPRSSKADLPTLCLIAIQKAKVSAVSSVRLIKSLAVKATTPDIKKAYKTCLRYYNYSLGDLDASIQLLGTKEFEELKGTIFAVIFKTSFCDEVFEKMKQVQEPPKLVQANRELSDLANVVVVISKKLAGEKSF